jgi:hypothetical protein
MGICIGPCGGPREVTFPYERGTPVMARVRPVPMQGLLEIKDTHRP